MLGWVPVRFHILLLSALISALGLVIAALPLEYYYRYVLIARLAFLILSGLRKPGRLRGIPPSKGRLAVLLSASILCGVLCGGACGYAFLADSHMTTDYSYVLSDPMWRSADGSLPPFMAANIVSITLVSPAICCFQRDWQTLPYIVICSTFVSLCYGLALYYVYRTYAVMKSNAHNMSSRTVKLQRQLALTLSVQVTRLGHNKCVVSPI